MRELVPEFEKASGHHVKTTVANAGTIAARLQSGELADLVIVLLPAWDRSDGRIDPDHHIGARPRQRESRYDDCCRKCQPCARRPPDSRFMIAPQPPDFCWKHDVVLLSAL